MLAMVDKGDRKKAVDERNALLDRCIAAINESGTGGEGVWGRGEEDFVEALPRQIAFEWEVAILAEQSRGRAEDRIDLGQSIL